MRVLFNHASRILRKGKTGLSPMMVSTSRARFVAAVLLMLSVSSLAGCTGALDTTVDPRASLEAYPSLIQEGEMVTLDARESSPVEGVITSYSWDFGDGSTAETVVGFTSHAYLRHGQYTVRLTITNDQGGTDDAIASIIVNGAPTINITMPASVRAGDAALLDASNSFDPEGDELTFSWDLNAAEDSDGDGDPTNDVDADTQTVLLDTATSGLILGMLRVDDSAGAFAVEPFSVNVTTRTFQVVWVTETVEVSWDEYLDQGETWTGNMTPGEMGRVMAFNAVLELNRDVAPPHDNFTLALQIPEENYKRTVNTEPGNYTTNEPARAEMTEERINEPGQDGMFTSDSEEALLRQLLSTREASRGQGTWIWSVLAKQSDPDALVGDLDPDPGNDWTLMVEVVIMRPTLTEVSIADSNK